MRTKNTSLNLGKEALASFKKSMALRNREKNTYNHFECKLCNLLRNILGNTRKMLLTFNSRGSKED